MVQPASASSNLHIRPAIPCDRDALFRICLKTADGGKDATMLYSDPKLPGYVWAVPYSVLEPQFAFVLAEGAKVIGYVVAAPDTVAFERRLDTEWWPSVRRATEGLAPTRPLDADLLERINVPRRHADWLAADYPAHLHINLLAQARSSGWGRRMVDVELAALRRAGVRGVHLGISASNENANGFYRHIGFTDISRGDQVLFGMKL
jgi:ribosomal protein S18 acetylase RimI-like enzyme